MPAHRPGLQSARRAHGWSQTEAARRLSALAQASGVPTAGLASLKSLLSRWENGHAVPEAHYQRLLGELYGRSAAELELAPTDPATAPSSVQRLRARVAAAAAVDGTLVRAWSEQLAAGRRLDDEVGAAGAAGIVAALVDELDRAVVHAIDPGVRAQAASLLAAAATLAGWQELDRADPEQAWRHFDRARTVAAATQNGLWPTVVRPFRPTRPAGTPEDDSAVACHGGLAALALSAVLATSAAEATAGLAATLVEVGDPGAALALLDHTTVPAEQSAQAWLQAARGAVLARRGRATEARHSFAAAEQAAQAPPEAAVRSTPDDPDRGAPDPAQESRVEPPLSAAAKQPAGPVTSGTGSTGAAADPPAPAPAPAPAGAALAPGDVRRRRAVAFALLGEPDAASALEHELAKGIRSARERAIAHAALAVARATAGPATAEHARTARRLAERIGSTQAIAILATGRADPQQTTGSPWSASGAPVPCAPAPGTATSVRP